MKTNLENYEERFVDYMEGQLDADEMREVEAFVAQHPELEEDFKLFCSTKLEPDTSVVYDKKERLMQPTTTIRPLYVRILAAASCAALLIGIGFRFLKPHQELVQQPLLAGLTPKNSQLIDNQQDNYQLRKSGIKVVRIPKNLPVDESFEEEVKENTFETLANDNPVEVPTTPEVIEPHSFSEPFEIAALSPITAISPIAAKPLEWNNFVAYDEDLELKMFVELGERLSTLDPVYYTDDNLLLDPIASLHDDFFSNLRQTTRMLYKRTAKTVMDIYYTTDYKINEAKDQLMASR